jgi:hypothetical protein
MRVYGRILRLGGKPDHDNEFFSQDCKVKIQGDIRDLPVVLAMNTRINVGRVENIEFHDDGVWANIRINEDYTVKLKHAREVTPLLGLCSMAQVLGDVKRGSASDPTKITSILLTGIMVGVNTDITCGGFDIIEEKDPHASMLKQCNNDCPECDCPCYDILDKEEKQDLQFEKAYDEAYGTKENKEKKLDLNELLQELAKKPKRELECEQQGYTCSDCGDCYRPMPRMEKLLKEPGFFDQEVKCDVIVDEPQPLAYKHIPLSPRQQELDQLLTTACGERFSYDDVLELMVTLNQE